MIRLAQIKRQNLITILNFLVPKISTDGKKSHHQLIEIGIYKGGDFLIRSLSSRVGTGDFPFWSSIFKSP